MSYLITQPSTTSLGGAEPRLTLPDSFATFKNTTESATETKTAKYGNIPRITAGSTTTLVSGTPQHCLHGVAAGDALTAIGFYLATVETEPTKRTHLWGALLNSSREVVARTADYTSNTNTPLTSAEAVYALKLTEAYAPAEDTKLWAVLCWVSSGGVGPILQGKEGSAGVNKITPIVGGTGPTGQTTPAEFKGTITLAGTAKVPLLWLI